MAKLLIIDDDQELCIYLEGFFAKRGCEVKSSFNGEEGLLSFKKDKPDLVLLDVKMPKVGGLEVLKQIRSQDKQTSVVMFSIAGDEPTRKQAEALGASGFIKKPFNIEELESVVSKALAKTIA